MENVRPDRTGNDRFEHDCQRLRNFPAIATDQPSRSVVVHPDRHAPAAVEGTNNRQFMFVAEQFAGSCANGYCLPGCRKTSPAWSAPSHRINTADEVAGRIDIDKQPLSDLIEAMHKHAVSRVIFAAGHSQLNRIEEAIGACEIERSSGLAGGEILFIPRSRNRISMLLPAGRCSFFVPPEVSWALLLKGIIDRVALSLLCCSWPFRWRSWL